MIRAAPKTPASVHVRIESQVYAMFKSNKKLVDARINIPAIVLMNRCFTVRSIL